MSLPVSKNKLKSDDRLPDDFLALQKHFMMLRPIHTKTDYARAMRIAETLAPMNDLTKIQTDYLETLSNNIANYEKRAFDDAEHEPLDVLKFLLEENGLNGSDLGRILGQRSLGALILSGRRGLSKAHIAILSKRFAVSPAIFLPG